MYCGERLASAILLAMNDKHKLRIILEEHDITAFHDFCLEHTTADVARWPKDKLSKFMHILKARQVHFGDLSQQSRNFLREESLNSKGDLWSGDLRDFAYIHDYIPLCNDCKWFRKGPDDEHPCMHLGGAPLDVACAGWAKNKV